jgi:hypothetical protein
VMVIKLDFKNQNQNIIILISELILDGNTAIRNDTIKCEIPGLLNNINI